jgi:hypothetical protein
LNEFAVLLVVWASAPVEKMRIRKMAGTNRARRDGREWADFMPALDIPGIVRLSQ